MADGRLMLSSLKLNKRNTESSVTVEEVSNKDIAIIGIDVSMPMARNMDEFWENIKNQIDCVREFPEIRKKDVEDYFKLKGIDASNLKYIESAYFDEIDKFDYSFFNMSPKEANLMHPLQRTFLETVWKAVEDAGYGNGRLAGSKTGLYIGSISDLEGYRYKQIIQDVDPSLLPIAISGNLSSMIMGRIAYILDLKGPSMLIDTACSSSLVAVHLACKALNHGECDMAIAGGARISLFALDVPEEKIGAESKDNRTRSFDNNSDGYGVGEGSAAIILKPLHKAIRDRDNIYAVIKGSAVTHDGTSVGLTAPNPESQKTGIIEAWEESGIDPETISYIETHGTATKIGDPIEIEGLNKAFRRYTNKKQFCAIGSVKSNIGHLYECAGIAGLIKVVMAIKNKQLPPNVHFKSPNNKINFEDSPVYVNTKLRSWDTGNQVRRAGISSFGLSGTNCHMVLEEYIEAYDKKQDDLCPKVLTVSAKSKKSLDEFIKSYICYLDKTPEADVLDLCYTAGTGRGHYNHRLAIIVYSFSDLKEKMAKLNLMDYENVNEQWYFYGEHKLVSEDRENKMSYEITEIEKNQLTRDAKNIVSNYVLQNGDKLNEIREMCRLYVKGADVEWKELYREWTPKKVSLPVYPFLRTRCWIEMPSASYTSKNQNNLLYTIKWKKARVESFVDNQVKDTVVVFKNKKDFGNELCNELRSKWNRVIEVTSSTEYKKADESVYFVGNKKEDYISLFEDIGMDNITHIMHLFTLDSDGEKNSLQELDESLESGVYSLLYMAQAIHCAGLKKEVNLILLSRYVNKVSGDEPTIMPENSSIFGLGKVIAKENPLLKIKAIDADEKFSVVDLLNEINNRGEGFITAFRNGERFVEEFVEINDEETEKVDFSVKSDGVYIITGGLGGIGLQMAKYLSTVGKANISLVSRTKIPSREEWDQILKNSDDSKLKRQLKTIMDIESSGANVMCYSADIGNFGEVEKMVSNLKSTFGRINGIIHGAGIGENEPIESTNQDKFKRVLNPKIHGTWILDKVTKDEQMDFFVLFSSVATFFSASGQGGYVAANSYLDSFADYRNNFNKRTITVNWGTWKETGMAFDYGFNIDTIVKAMTTEQALNGIDTVFRKEIYRVLIAEINYDINKITILEQANFLLSQDIRNRIADIKTSGDAHKKMTKRQYQGEVKLLGKDNQDYSEVEKKIADICRNTLGFNEINIYESFFEMGADSFLIRKLYSELDKEYPGVIMIAEIFEYPTISKLAKLISSKINEPDIQLENIQEQKNKLQVEEEMSDIIDKMEKGELSIDDVLKNITNL